MNDMKKIVLLTALLAAGCAGGGHVHDVDCGCGEGELTLSDSLAIVTVEEDGTLSALVNAVTGHNYAGGEGLWRLYYNDAEQKEIEVDADDQFAVTEYIPESDAILVHYDSLTALGRKLDMKVLLTITLKDGQVRFASWLENNEPGTIIREFQYPLVGNLQLPEGYRLLTTHTGGQVFDDPVRKIADMPRGPLYMTPASKFRQYDLQYPRHAASNCFAFFGEKDGLYFGSHDPSFQQTWHGLRAYPEGDQGARWEDFNRLEGGFYRYPNITEGQTWGNACSVIVPYNGSWRETAHLYRAWADTWWEKTPPPEWVRRMTGWQRLIFKHQYGEYLRRYEDLPGHIFEVGESVGCYAVLAFGWWAEGMDNGYPDYSPDMSQGGDGGWARAVADYRAKGGRLIQYFNGRLIDVESEFYRSGAADAVTNKDNHGIEFTEHYKFTGEGTTLGYYDSRTFAIADMSKRPWRDMLLDMADRALACGADAVFYDQLGVAEEFPNWDRTGSSPVQDIFTGRYKAEALKEIRDHVKASDPAFALGTEWLSDCTSQYCDFVHIVEFTALPESFPDWFRYTFPEVIWSDRCVRDDNDVPRRVNNTLLKGLVNDIEVFRCRGMINETPVYQAHLAKVNALRSEFPELLLEGRFLADEGFTCSNPAVTARAFAAGDSLAIVSTYTGKGTVYASLRVPGYRFVTARTIGPARVRRGSLRFGENGLAVSVYKKEGRSGRP